MHLQNKASSQDLKIYTKDGREVVWLPDSARIEYIKTSHLPAPELITSVFALCFQNESLLMIKHDDRGLDLPGGHIEPGESPEEALVREFQEEASAEIVNIRPIARVEVTLFGPCPLDYRYPFPKSYMICYLAEVDQLNGFKGEFETHGRVLLKPEQARVSAWVKNNYALYQLALDELIAGRQ